MEIVDIARKRRGFAPRGAGVSVLRAISKNSSISKKVSLNFSCQHRDKYIYTNIMPTSLHFTRNIKKFKYLCPKNFSI